MEPLKSGYRMLARTRHKVAWLFGGLFVIFIAVAFGKTAAYHRERECRLELDNARLSEWLFLSLVKTEILKTIPDVSYTISSSGGANEHGNRFELTSVHDVLFDERVPTGRLEKVVDSLSGNREIATWLSLAVEKQGTRFCRFHVERGADQSCIRMLMHVSNHVNGLSHSDLNRLFSGEIEHPSPEPPN